MRLLVAILLAPMAVAAQPTPPAPYVLHHARIYTVNPAQPVAEAMAVQGGRIAAVGTEADVLAAFPDWPRVDADGQTVVPGLIDAHAHLMGLGQALRQADLVGARTKAEAVGRVRDFAATLPPGAWVTGRGWDQNDWGAAGSAEAAFPTAADLDAHFPDRPVVLSRVDGHASWLNSAALRAAGLDPARPAPPDPEGGQIVRDANGRPTGILVDAAEALVLRVTPAPDRGELAQRLDAALAETVRYGLTGVHEAGVEADTLRLYRRYIAEGRFPLRLYAMVGPGPAFDAACAHGPRRDPRLVVRALKLFADGALGSRGAALLAGYADEPASLGLLIQSPDALRALATRAMRCGLQVNTHAIGDRGVRVVLDAYEAALRETGGGAGRHRVEHAQVVAPADVARFAALGVIASVQPTHATSDMPWVQERLGPERIGGAYAWRRLLDAGARLALGSDFPVESANPLLGFYAAVTRQDRRGHPPGGWQPAQKLTRAEALRGFTLDAAYAAFMESEVGSLEVGKRADFVILSRDVMAVPAPEILHAEVVATYLDGAPVYRRGG